MREPGVTLICMDGTRLHVVERETGGWDVLIDIRDGDGTRYITRCTMPWDQRLVALECAVERAEKKHGGVESTRIAEYEPPRSGQKQGAFRVPSFH